MKRTTKGAIAVGAATLLLLGGGGTFALWNDAATTNAGIVVSGELQITGGDTGVWYHYDDFVLQGTGAAPITIATYNVVPQDDLIFVTNSATLTAQGSNLYYTFDSNVNSATAAGLGYTVTTSGYSAVTPTPVPIVLSTDLPGASAAATAGQFSDGVGSVPVGAPVWHVTDIAEAAVNFNIGLRVVFDASGTDDFESQLNLGALSFVLKQVVEV